MVLKSGGRMILKLVRVLATFPVAFCGCMPQRRGRSCKVASIIHAMWTSNGWEAIQDLLMPRHQICPSRSCGRTKEWQIRFNTETTMQRETQIQPIWNWCKPWWSMVLWYWTMFLHRKTQVFCWISWTTAWVACRRIQHVMNLIGWSNERLPLWALAMLRKGGWIIIPTSRCQRMAFQPCSWWWITSRVPVITHWWMAMQWPKLWGRGIRQLSSCLQLMGTARSGTLSSPVWTLHSRVPNQCFLPQEALSSKQISMATSSGYSTMKSSGPQARCLTRSSRNGMMPICFGMTWSMAQSLKWSFLSPRGRC